MNLKTLVTLIDIDCKKILPWLITVFLGMLLASGFFFWRNTTLIYENISLSIRGMTVETYINQFGTVSLTQIVSPFHIFVFAVSGLILLASAFYLWYKEWLGQSKRIYLLLSLKGPRFTIFLSKLAALLMASFIYYGMVLVSLLLGLLILNVRIPAEFLGSGNMVGEVLRTTDGIGIILPTSILNFLYRTVLFAAVFAAISVWVLCNRTAKKIIGFIAGMLYCMAMLWGLIYVQNLWLFVDERALADWAFALGAFLLSTLLSWWLLNKKISI